MIAHISGAGDLIQALTIVGCFVLSIGVCAYLSRK